MRLEPFSIDHFDRIEWQSAQQAGEALFQREWADEIAESSHAQTLMDADGRVIACAGVIPTRIIQYEDGGEVIAESLAWAIFSPSLPIHAKSIIKAIRAFLETRDEYRIEAYVDAAQPKASAFLARLGFGYERTLTDVCPDGRVMHLYARVRN